MKAVIMCGGSGTRLWPISRTSTPKQFIPLFNNKSLFELTIERNKDLVNEFIIVVNEKQLPLCKKQVPKDVIAKFIIEPVGRNTAPAIALAAHLAEGEDLLILASDHLIKDQKIYKDCVREAQVLSQDKKLITFGITPQYPETGYGYIESQNNDVLSFKEKPDAITAKKYFEQGNYYWNSGMFYFNANTFLDELKQYNSEIVTASSNALKNSKKEEHCFFINHENMMKIPADSIDYALMEKSKHVKVVPSAFNWSDLGSFDSLYEHLPQDQDGNTQTENYIQQESKNNLVISNKRVISTINLEDLIIVDTDDALLIARRGESQKVKPLLEEIKQRKSELLN